MAESANSGQRDLKFIGSDQAGFPLKRKQVQQACEPCRKKKKRCTHTSSGASPKSSQRHHDIDAIAASQLLQFSSQERVLALKNRSGDAVLQRSEDEPPTFIGELHPESILIHAVTTDADRSQPDSGVSGLWYRSQLPNPVTETAARGTKSRKPKTETHPEKRDDSLGADPSRPSGVEQEPAATMDGVHDLHDITAHNDDGARHANEGILEDSPGIHTDFPTAPRSLNDPCKCSSAKPLVRECHDCLRRLIKQASEFLVDSVAHTLLPKAASWRAIKSIYTAKIHPILPLFNVPRLDNIPDPRCTGLSRIDQLIVASICHAVSFDPVSHKHVQPRDDRKSSEYHTRMVGLATELAKLIDKKKHLFDYLRAMTLLCFFWQVAPSNPQAPLDAFAEVVMLVQTHGLHLGRLRIWEIQKWVARGFANPPDISSFAALFSCIVSVDRLNAAYYGRPVLFNEHDLVSTKYLWGGRSPESSAAPEEAPQTDREAATNRPLDVMQADSWLAHTVPVHMPPAKLLSDSQPPAFCLYMSIVFYLDQIIELYRPNPQWQEVTLPVFEQLVLDAGAENEPSPILATLEILYHAISILSVRMTHSLFQDSLETNDTTEKRGAESKHLPSPNLNARRSLSADRIYWVVKTHAVSALPFVPYGLSLSLSVSYRKWRFSRIAMFRSRGRAMFTAISAVLTLWSNFSCAHRNIKLANTVIRKMKQTEDRVKGAPSQGMATPAPTVASAGGPHHAAMATSPAMGNSHSHRSSEQARPQLTPISVGEAIPAPQRSAQLDSEGPDTWTPLFDGPTPAPAPSYIGDTGAQPKDHEQLPMPPDAIQEADPMLSVPASLLNNSSGFDVFNYVDKGSFPQDTVDFAFYSNLDPTCPSNGWLDFNPWDVEVGLDWNAESDAWILKRCQ